jgi:hypothetical protein
VCDFLPIKFLVVKALKSRVAARPTFTNLKAPISKPLILVLLILHPIGATTQPKELSARLFKLNSFLHFVFF